MKKVDIFHDGFSLIYGLKCTYEMENGLALEGNLNIDFHIPVYETASLLMEENDHVKSIQCFC
jgi:hypothetical protein